MLNNVYRITIVSTSKIEIIQVFQLYNKYIYYGILTLILYATIRMDKMQLHAQI